jgi:hypothetical protein
MEDAVRTTTEPERTILRVENVTLKNRTWLVPLLAACRTLGEIGSRALIKLWRYSRDFTPPKNNKTRETL